MGGAPVEKAFFAFLDDSDGVPLMRMAAKGIIRETRPEEEKTRRFRDAPVSRLVLAFVLRTADVSSPPSVRTTSGFQHETRMSVPLLQFRHAAGDIGFGRKGDIPGKTEPVKKQRVLRPTQPRLHAPGAGPVEIPRGQDAVIRRIRLPTGDDTVRNEPDAERIVEGETSEPSGREDSDGLKTIQTGSDRRRIAATPGQNRRACGGRAMNGFRAVCRGHDGDRIARNHVGRHLEGRVSRVKPRNLHAFTLAQQHAAFPQLLAQAKRVRDVPDGEEDLPSGVEERHDRRRGAKNIHNDPCISLLYGFRRTQRRKESFHGIASSLIRIVFLAETREKAQPVRLCTF